MSKPPLGRLEQVDLRSYWTHEAHEFTPWLARDENIALLGETIGIELEVLSQEESVGPFRADVVCRDTASDAKVLIENQLGTTDHTHLGQILTYAAGLQAVNIIWIASRFTDEHRAAVDWLNGMTGEGVNFFALEIQLWKIGDSAPAPKFNVISMPNDWMKAASGARSLGDDFYLEFWEGFLEYLQANGSSVKFKRALAQSGLPRWTGFPGVRIWASASRQIGKVTVDLSMYHSIGEEILRRLREQREEIDAVIPEKLEWSDRPKARGGWIEATHMIDIKDRDKWPDAYAWLQMTLETFDRVFRPRLKLITESADGPGSVRSNWTERALGKPDKQ